MNHNQMNMHVPMNPVGAAPNVAMQIQLPSVVMQQQSPQQIQQQQQQAVPQQTQQDKMDNISKVKTLMGSLRESIPMTLKSAAQILHQNHNVDSISQKGMENPVPRFDKNLEEFFSLCDQMELHLRTAITCIQQAQSAAHYLPLTVIPSRIDSGPTTQTNYAGSSNSSFVKNELNDGNSQKRRHTEVTDNVNDNEIKRMKEQLNLPSSNSSRNLKKNFLLKKPKFPNNKTPKKNDKKITSTKSTPEKKVDKIENIIKDLEKRFPLRYEDLSTLKNNNLQETTLSYPQYLNTVRLQISYAKDIHDTLVAAAQNISPTE